MGGTEMKLQTAVAVTIVAVALAACAQPPEPVVRPVEVTTVEVPRPAPIVPSIDPLRLRPVQWTVITPDNIDEKFQQIRNGELVLFAVTAEGYENIALNLSDIRAMVQQQQVVIALYERSYR
jgi:hypothetical protein